MFLVGQHIKLRALEPEDLEFLYNMENNPLFWEVSHTKTPFSRYVLRQYLENSHLDLYEAKQLRLMITEKDTEKRIGMIDLFDFNPQHQRAGIGVGIHSDFQKKGYASEALDLLIAYCFQHLNLHQLYVNITPDNTKSIALFTKFGFAKAGVKKDWLLVKGTYKDELTFQLINE